MPFETSTNLQAGWPLQTLRSDLAARLSGPGGLYNIGNLLGFSMGVTLQMHMANAGEGGFFAGAASYLAGNWSASALTAATVVFFWSGEVYHRAWSGGKPDPAGLRRGDFLSGIGAVALGISLLMVGDIVLATTAGLLHAVGKFGSAFNPGGKKATLLGLPLVQLYRVSVLFSRFPAIAIALLAIAQALGGGSDLFASLGMPTTLLVCYLLWSWADILLFRK
jgi:hypothetical protein